MQLRDILKIEAVSIDLESTEKEDVLKELVGLISEDIPDEKKILKILIERENLGSTGIGQGIAVPHGKTDKIVFHQRERTAIPYKYTMSCKPFREFYRIH